MANSINTVCAHPTAVQFISELSSCTADPPIKYRYW